MKGILLKAPQDYFALVDRRRWWIIGVSSALGLVALLVAISLPSIYVSETLILVRPQEVPETVVQDFVAWDTNQRLISLQEQVLSRTNMERILDEFPQGFDELRSLRTEQQVELLRSRINIDVGADRRGRETFVPFFRVSYQDRDPALAQKVTERLGGLFIEQDMRTREDQVVNTADFLSREVDRVSEALKVAEDELAALKLRFGKQLPEQLEANLRTLDRLQQQLTATEERRSRLITDRLAIQRLLAETDPVLERPVRGAVGTQAARTPPSPQVTLYRQKELELQQLRARYTEQHPTIQQLRAELAKLEEDIPPEQLLEIQDPLPVESATTSEPNPTYQQLNSQLLRFNNELEMADQRIGELEASLAAVNQRVLNTPEVEQQVVVVQRRYDSLKLEYDRLRDRQGEADLARSLEANQKGEQFMVTDHANYPYVPSKPNRMMVLAVGLGIALGAGLLVAAAVDIADQRVYTYAEVEQLLGAPVLAEIPTILTEPEQQTARRRSWFRVAAAITFVGLGLAIVYTVYTVPQLRMESSEFMARLLKW